MCVLCFFTRNSGYNRENQIFRNYHIFVFVFLQADYTTRAPTLYKDERNTDLKADQHNTTTPLRD